MKEKFTIPCPNCDAKLRATVGLVGKVCSCPGCGWKITVKTPLPSDADVPSTATGVQ